MDYYKKLFELYARTEGIFLTHDNKEYIYDKHKQDFIEWLEIYKYSTYEYRMYIQQFFGINLDDFYLAEIGKGNIDSIIRDDALMITPYGYTFTDTYHLNSKLNLDEDITIDYGYFTENGDNLKTFITQNPYLYTNNISVLKKVYLKYNKNIILGMYGKINDHDRMNKIRILKQFKKNVDPYNQVLDLDYNTKDDNYFCAITKK